MVESERRRPCLISMLDTFIRTNYFSVYRISDDECKYLCGLSKDLSHFLCSELLLLINTKLFRYNIYYKIAHDRCDEP
jgi:hypothetical protein